MFDFLVQNGEDVMVAVLLASFPTAIAALFVLDRARKHWQHKLVTVSDPQAVRRARRLVSKRKTADGYALLSLSEFFDENHDRGSIAPNLSGWRTPSLSRFAATLNAVALEPTVQWVLVEASNDSLPTEWPVSEAVYIVASAPLDIVRRWLTPLCPSDIVVGTWHGKALPFPELASDHTTYCAWWD